jgi:hypothetical protein
MSNIVTASSPIRQQLLFLVESDFDLCYQHKALLLNFFENTALLGDLKGRPDIIYHRYRRALICFMAI